MTPPTSGSPAAAPAAAPAAPVRLVDLLPDLSDPASLPVAEAAAVEATAVDTAAQQLAQAYADGLEAGRVEAAAAADARRSHEAALVRDALARLDARVDHAVRDALATQAGDLADSAWQLATWAIGAELQIHPTALTDAVTQALADVDRDVTVTIYAHPTTVTHLDGWVAASAPRTLVVRTDATLAPGELRAVTETGTRVEATVAEMGRRARAYLVSTAAAEQSTPEHPGHVPGAEQGTR